MRALVPYQWTTAGIALLIAGIIILLIRKDRLHIRRSIWWLLVAACVMIMGFAPTLMDRLGLLLGVSYPPVLILTIGVGMILIKILTMDLDRSRQERMIRRLVQQLALAEEVLKRQGISLPGLSEEKPPTTHNVGN